MTRPKYKLMMQETSEAQNLDAILQYLCIEPRVNWGPFRTNLGKIRTGGSRWGGWSIARMVWQGTRWGREAARGFPDVICAVSGILVCLEAKRASTDEEEAQTEFRKMCEAGGVVYAVVRGVDDAVAVIKGVKR